ncbi:MarC family protein [Photobacterium angustum]|uniref:UPF0056 membrane protein n=1 Tax=Photobacterium angustum TaxID=661 RepID=A0A2S7VHG6_PHOAN|nr:hypothetical protein BTO08_15035 [Photobacterium angustum]
MLLDSYIYSFIKLVVILNPITMYAIFITYTRSINKKEVQDIAVKTTLSVVLTFLITTWFGIEIFNILGINLASLQIAGGLSLLISSLRGLNQDADTNLVTDSNIAIVPLSIPIIAGPASLSVLMSLSNDKFSSHNFLNKISISAASITLTLLLGTLFYFSKSIESLIGEITINIISRLSHLILACISVGLIYSGFSYYIH